MSKLISEILFSYTNKAGKLIKGVRFASQAGDRWPLECYSQECIRLSRFLGRYGDKSIAVLEAFLSGGPKVGSALLGYSQYENNDMIELYADEADKRPLRFGKGKAGKVMAALKQHGVASVLVTLQDVVGDAQPSDHKPARKGGKGKGGKGGGGQPAVEVEEMVADMPPARPAPASRPTPVAPAEMSIAGQIMRNEKLIAASFEAIQKLQAETRALRAQLVAVPA